MPPGDWFLWLILAGRGWGKNRTATENISRLVRGPTPLRAPPGAPEIMSIIADTPFDMRQYTIEGPSGFKNVGPPDYRPLHEPSKRTLTWPNGIKALLFSAEDPETLRGASGSFFWWDEMAKSRYAQEGWDNMLFGMREGNPRGIVTTTPRPRKMLKELSARKSTFLTRGSTFDNRENLAPVFFREVIEPLVGTRKGRQEIEAEILDEAEGALWSRTMLDDALYVGDLPDMKRVVVAIDPATTAKAESDETGIVAAGLGIDDRGYVFADRSGRYSPANWAKNALRLYRVHGADRIVAEGNNGGEMVRHTIQTEWPNAPVTIVHASRGKRARAEPVAALYEQGRVSHVPGLSELEDQLVGWEPLSGLESPDRLDAMVWALTDLMLTGAQFEWYVGK